MLPPQRLEATCFLGTASICRREPAGEPLPVPFNAGTNDFVESERPPDGGDIKVRTGRQQYQMVAGAAVRRNGNTRVRVQAVVQQLRHEACRPGLDLTVRGSAEHGADPGGFERATVVIHQRKARERGERRCQVREARGVVAEEAGEVGPQGVVSGDRPVEIEYRDGALAAAGTSGAVAQRTGSASGGQAEPPAAASWRST